MAKHRITITDIAREMGVTPSTVSRSLSGNKRVSLKTRERVIAVAKELGYQPNVLASSLRRGRSDTIGMIVPRVNRHFFSNVISGVEAVLNPAGLNLLICQSHERMGDERKAIRSLLGNRVGGIIISHSVETSSFDHYNEVLAEEIPLVQFDRVSDEIKGPRVVNDNFLGGMRSTQHLIKNGCKRIAHFAGSLHVNVYKERFEGYKYALEKAGLVFDQDLLIENCILQETGAEAVSELVGSGKIDGIFAASDFSALGAIRKLKEMKIFIPGQVKITGFANEPFSELVEPSLSSVEQNAFEMGTQVARLIMENLGKQSIPDDEIHVPVRLIPRQSSLTDKSEMILDRDF